MIIEIEQSQVGKLTKNKCRLKESQLTKKHRQTVSMVCGMVQHSPWGEGQALGRGLDLGARQARGHSPHSIPIGNWLLSG